MQLTPGLRHAFFTPGLLPIPVCSQGQWARDDCCHFLRFVANTAYVLPCQRRTQAGNCTRGRTAPCVRAGYGPRSSCRSWCASAPCERWAVSSVCRPARCSNCSRSRRCSRRPWRAPPAVIVHFGADCGLHEHLNGVVPADSWGCTMSPARRHDVVAQAKFCARMNWWELESLAEQFVRARASNTTTLSLVPRATDSVQEWPIAVQPIVLSAISTFHHAVYAAQAKRLNYGFRL